MKRIYLLIVLLIAISANTFAQRSVDLEMIQAIPANTTIYAWADQPRTYVFVYRFKNNGPDTVSHEDTIRLRAPYNSWRLTLTNTGGIQVGDTVSFRDTVTLSPGASAVKTDNPNYDWCDSVYLREKGGAVVPDPVMSNNRKCTQVHAIIWLAGINDVDGRNGITLYPNPANTAVNIKHSFTGNSEGYLTIKDITGKTLYREELQKNLSGEKVFTIDVSQFSTGIHIVELVTDGKKAVTKFTIQ